MSNRRRDNTRSALDTIQSAVDSHYEGVKNTLFDEEKLQKQISLVSQSDGTVRAGSFQLTEIGIDVDKVSINTSRDEWKRLGEMLVKLEGSIQWLIGDWLILGEKLFKHGDITQLAIDFDYDRDRFYDMKSMSLAIPYESRVPNVSYTHHRIVRALDDRHRWLLMSRTNNWTVSELRKQIRLSKKEELPDVPLPTLTSNKFYDSFNRIMNNIATGEAIKTSDIKRIEEWLEQVKLINQFDDISF